jgi:glycosyltransferase involved in cell wall biosynthesis
MRKLLLRDSVGWFGNHTGYERLTYYLAKHNDYRQVKSRPGKLVRYVGSSYARWKGRWGKGPTDFSELEFRLRRRLWKPNVSHIIYLENHLELLRIWPDQPNDLIGTIHLPASIWKPDQCKLLSRLTLALVLYQRDIPFFEKHVGKERVKFIHHGADTDFFTPDFSKIKTPLRILYSGVYLRNEAMLVRIVQKMSEQMPKIKFDLLVPAHHRNSPPLAPLLRHPSVTWHSGLNDQQLRDLYQSAYLMLLPMNDSGANTAVVEALASGLPIVTTDVGGIRDYGGGTCFPIVANDDDDDAIELIKKYLAKPDWRNEMANNCRTFAENILAWPLVEKKHMEVYQQLTA